jgi:hypothetical protein
MTVKADELVAVRDPTVTEIVPVVAPAGTEVVMLVVVEAVTVALTPLKLTVLLPGVVLKLVPLMVTDVPAGPLAGENPDIAGGTVKLDELVAVSKFTVTEMVPVVAPAGTVVVMLVAVEAVTTAGTPLKLTVLLPGVALKFVPVMVTVVPGNPLVGVKLEIAGGKATKKFEALVAVWIILSTVTGPVVAPAGTVVVMLVAVAAVTVAPVPLNITILK